MKHTSKTHFAGLAAATWAVAGFLFFMLYAIKKLALISMAALGQPFSLLQWFVLFLNLAFMGYSEGYKGFHLAFSPRFAARARHLATSRPGLVKLSLAPLFCMSFFGAPRRRVIATWLLALMIVCFILVFHYIPQPWRGILDAGVVFGLSWGLLSTLYFLYRTFSKLDNNIDPELSGTR